MWKTILAMMLFLYQPGKSIYSQVPTTDQTTAVAMQKEHGVLAYRPVVAGQAPLQCHQQNNPFCVRPRYHKRRNEWRRPETWAEGVRRYALIARAAEQVLGEGKWKSDRGLLLRLLVTVAFHESGFRRDVHSGVGSASRGDCRWTFKGGKKHKRIPGSCRSHCLVQMLYGANVNHKYLSRQIVGTDMASTKRCLEMGLLALDHHAPRCKGNAACAFAAYGGVRSAKDPRIQARAGTYFKLGQSPGKLDAHVEALLAKP